MTEKQINDALIEMQENFDKKAPAFRRAAKQALALARIRVVDIIAKYEKNGKVPKNRMNAMLTELTAVENALYRDLLSQTTIIIEDSAEEASEGLNAVLIGAIGVTALLVLRDGDEDSDAFKAAGFLLAIGMGLLALIKGVLDTVLGRRGDDGLNLRDRLRRLANDIIADVRKSLRKSIQTSEEISDIQRKVSQIFGTEEWRVDRITDTEASVAYRTAIARAAERSDLVAGLKIIDFPHGHPGVHETHKCYIYAQADDHGMGKGVYPVTTRKIRNPHPQCRSRLVVVMKEGVLDA